MMSNKKTKLELTWIGKNEYPKLEPRILLEDPDKSYQIKNPSIESAIYDNRLIFGDNLLALKALEQEFSRKVKCVFIDPPYNTGSAFEHYDDGVEHSMWLSLMRDRLELLHKMLCDEGSIWITIDDNECHYLKVLCDEIFGRKNFVANIIWQKKYGAKSDSKYLSASHDNILVYAKQKELLKLNRLEKTEKQTSRYTNRDNDPRGVWKAGDVLRNEVRDYAVFPVTTPSGKTYYPPAGTSWRYTKEKFESLINDNRIWFGKKGDGRPAVKRFISDVTDTIPATTVWLHNEVGHNDESAKEGRVLFGIDLFDTPKPERLLRQIIYIATDPGDLILDSFAGSGTTGAVAHKMGRRWIMVELGEHCHTHIIPRLQKVINGEDKGGISNDVNWQGGGGFKYYRLAPSLLEKDKWNNWVINHKYNAPMLSEALCKLEGFTYAPSDSIYWQQGYSTETDFIYVTTAHLTNEQLEQLSDEVGTERTLLVLCTSFKANTDHYLNLTVKKIPQHVLSRCEWGHDDYSLHVKNLPYSQLEQHEKNEANEEMIFNEPTS